MTLDSKDKQILSMLDNNARIPITVLAKKTHLNKDVVRYRINKLEGEKTIVGYYTIIDIHKLGYFTARVYFDLINVDEKLEMEFIKFLDKQWKAGQIFRIDGQYQIGILSWEKSLYDLEKKLRLLRSTFGNTIGEYRLSIFTQLHHYSRKYLPFGSKNSIVIKEANLQERDEIDISILSLLSENARMNSVDIAKKLNLPQRTVFFRIKNLEKNKIILGYRTNINIASLGYENYFLELYANKGQNLKEIESYIQQHVSSVGIDYVLDGADIEIEIECEGRQALLLFLKELKNRFKSIRKIRYWSTLEYLKIRYFPA